MEYESPLVWLRVTDRCASSRPAIPLAKERAGGPQLTGSWLFPVMPASPDTFSRFAKNGVVRAACRL